VKKFKTLQGIAAPYPFSNVDTDAIYPKQFLKVIRRTGLAPYLFYEARRLADGSQNPDFILNREPYTRAKILIALENFGCGSSREHAPWALADFGITCVIAPSFADIFYNNCFKNGILSVVLPREEVDTLMQHAQSSSNLVTVDLPQQTVRAGNHQFEFTLDAFRKHCLMNGLDDIGLTLEKSAEIKSYEARLAAERPWI
jgi:3-isopropylmalate/(R)-2-methylmalate dehydratase small subunit